MIDTGAGTAENYPVFSVAGGRARNQNFMPRRRQCGERRRPDAAAAAHEPAGRRDAGVQGHHQQLRRRVRPLDGRHRDDVDALGNESVPRQRVRIAANDALDARNFFAAETPPIRLNQFGGTLRRSRQAGTRRSSSAPGSDAAAHERRDHSTVPTLANRHGDFSDLRNSCRPADRDLRSADQPSAVSGQRRFPATASTRWRSRRCQYFPLPNRQGTSTNANNYVGNSDRRSIATSWSARLDHKLRRRRSADGPLLHQQQRRRT